MPVFENWTIIQPEFTSGDSRFDFYIEKENKKGLVEVKSVTLIENNVASFPDAVSERAVKHVNGLKKHVDLGYETFVIFLVSVSANYFIPNYHLHPEFHTALLGAKNRVKIITYSFQLDENLHLEQRVTPVKIPFDYLENINLNKGTYISIYYLDKNEKIKAGALKETTFQKGYYLYAGSAMNSLTARTVRHSKRVKNKKWHIDYIHPPMKHVKTKKFVSLNIECEIADALSGIYESIPEFGASDCKCKSHLFFSKTNPEKDVRFIRSVFNLGFHEKYIR
jgi:sugar fermentation stimulation protein A